MSEPTFVPIPTTYKRGVLRWVLLAFHAIPFALVVFGYPTLVNNYPEMFGRNEARMALMGWATILLAHLAVVCILEFLEGVYVAWKVVRRRREYRRYQKERAKQMVRWTPHS